LPRGGRQGQRRPGVKQSNLSGHRERRSAAARNFIWHSRHADARIPQSAGGTLTDEQVQILVREMRARWSKPEEVGNATPPPYAASTPGDLTRGAAVYAIFCASCHGSDGRGTPKGSAIVDDSYLALVSDQGLRTLVIAGRPDLRHPDWRGYVPGRAMTPQEMTDLVAWLVSKRAAYPGQPYASKK